MDATDPIGGGLYADPVAYDVLHARGTAAEVAGLARIQKDHTDRAAARSSTWFEPACGTGRCLIAAAKRGVRAVGLDASRSMIQYARERARRLGARVELHVGDMARVDAHLKPHGVDLAFNLINSIRHLSTDAQMLEHFEGIARVLRPGGAYAVGISLSCYGVEGPAEDVWIGARGGLRVRQVVQYLPPETPEQVASREEHVHSHLELTRPSGREHRDASYVLRTYDRAQWTALLERSALEPRAIVDEDGTPFDPGPIGYGVWVLVPRGGAPKRARRARRL